MRPGTRQSLAEETKRWRITPMGSGSIMSIAIHKERSLLSTVIVATAVVGLGAQGATASSPTGHVYDETGVREVLAGAAAMPGAALAIKTSRAVSPSSPAHTPAHAHRSRQRAATAAA